MINPIFVYKGKLIQSGIKVSCKIRGEKIADAKLVKANGGWYLCQDIHNGAGITDKHGYKYSYAMSSTIDVNNPLIIKFLSNEIEILETLEIKSSDRFTYFSVDSDRLRFLTYKISDSKDRIKKPVILSSIPICMRQPHPDCCGVNILYSFESSSSEYSKYTWLTEEQIKILKEYFNSLNPALIAHLAGYQVEAQNLLKKLGFVAITEYLNNNSGNKIIIYHFNNIKNSES